MFRSRSSIIGMSALAMLWVGSTWAQPPQAVWNCSKRVGYGDVLVCYAEQFAVPWSAREPLERYEQVLESQYILNAGVMAANHPGLSRERAASLMFRTSSIILGGLDETSLEDDKIWVERLCDRSKIALDLGYVRSVCDPSGQVGAPAPADYAVSAKRHHGDVCHGEWAPPSLLKCDDHEKVRVSLSAAAEVLETQRAHGFLLHAASEAAFTSWEAAFVDTALEVELGLARGAIDRRQAELKIVDFRADVELPSYVTVHEAVIVTELVDSGFGVAEGDEELKDIKKVLDKTPRVDMDKRLSRVEKKLDAFYDKVDSRTDDVAIFQPQVEAAVELMAAPDDLE